LSKILVVFREKNITYELKIIKELKLILKLNQMWKNYIKTVTKSKSKLKL